MRIAFIALAFVLCALGAFAGAYLSERITLTALDHAHRPLARHINFDPNGHAHCVERVDSNVQAFGGLRERICFRSAD